MADAARVPVPGATAVRVALRARGRVVPLDASLWTRVAHRLPAGWRVLFGRGPDGADRALLDHATPTWTTEGEFADREITAPGGTNVWICELGNADENSSFARFVDGVLGAEVEVGPDQYLLTAPSGLKGADIFLHEMSVMATENAVMAASLAEGATTIRNAASEPHVQELCRLLVAMGAAVQAADSSGSSRSTAGLTMQTSTRRDVSCGR